MNKKVMLAATFVSIIFIVLAFAFAGKGRGNNAIVETTEALISVPTDLKPETSSAEDTTEDAVETVVITDPRYNRLTGQMTEQDLSTRRPIAVMFDNFYSARPQAGLDKADIIYEILAEGLITRYMGIYYGEYPDHIGPVRSSRPYFVLKALEYDPYYVHVGGSTQALSDIRKYAVADIDGLTSGAYWREKHKKAPHNVYTSADALLKEAKRFGYKQNADFDFMSFYETFTENPGEKASEITFVYKEPTQADKIGYNTSYKYNDEEKVYYRYTNGKPHLDEDSKAHLSCTNILVQYANTTVIDSEGRLKIDLIATGKGRYYTAGVYEDVTWEKASANAPTFFFDKDGEMLVLNPGVTWIQVVKSGNVETIE